MAHHVMHGIARFSGLDLGSLSEVIFPADLAFVVHRRGMTEDLGNISSMWRDQNGAFLRYLVARRELRCGSGTLCDHRGGACPACIMIPETSCIAGNQLLSRAALVGGRAPLWDTDQTPLRGFFEVVHDIRHAGQPPAPGVMPSDADIVRCAAPWPGTAARLLEAFASLGPGTWPLEQICRASASGIDPGLRFAGLGRTGRYGLMRSRPLRTTRGYANTPRELKRLVQVLSGADHFRRMRLNPAAIELAVTMPLLPSHLEKELASTSDRPGGFLTTSAAFSRLAETASRRLVVMTPFIDASGFRWLRRVFETTRTNCQKIVVLRNTDQYTVELGVQHADWLRAMQVSVRDYHLSHSAAEGALCRLRRSTRRSSLRMTRLPMWDQQICSLQAKGCRLRPVFWLKEVRRLRWLGLSMPSFASRGLCEQQGFLRRILRVLAPD